MARRLQNHLDYLKRRSEATRRRAEELRFLYDQGAMIFEQLREAEIDAGLFEGRLAEALAKIGGYEKGDRGNCSH